MLAKKTFFRKINIKSGALDQMAINCPDYMDPRSIRGRLRRARFVKIREMIEYVYDQKGDIVRILDVGGTAKYWGLLEPKWRQRIHVTVMNIDPGRMNEEGAPPDLGYELAEGNGCHMPQYADGEFDICHSNSVIEHVGSFQEMINFAEECRRVGQIFYHQTPEFWFPIEPHYGFPLLHWLPPTMRARLILSFKLGYGRKPASFQAACRSVDHIEIVSGWFVRKVFSTAAFYRERVFLLPKSSIVIGGSYNGTSYPQ